MSINSKQLRHLFNTTIEISSGHADIALTKDQQLATYIVFDGAPDAAFNVILDSTINSNFVVKNSTGQIMNLDFISGTHLYSVPVGGTREFIVSPDGLSLSSFSCSYTDLTDKPNDYISKVRRGGIGR